MQYIISPVWLLLVFPLFVHGQEFSERVRDFIAFDQDSFAIINVKLIDGTGGAIKEHQDIIIENGRISAIGDHNSLEIPEKMYVFDGLDHTLIPGLVMLHEHLFYTMPFEGQFNVGQMPFTFPRLYLAGGATTIRTAGSIQPESDISIRDLINEGLMTGPKMDVTGPFINRESGLFFIMSEIRSSQEAEQLVNFWADRGSTSFKVYQSIHKEDLEKIVSAAHQRNLKVTGHLCSVTYREAADAGIDCLEHGFFMASDFVAGKEENTCDPFERIRSLMALDENSPQMKELMDYLIDKNVGITSTLPVFEPYTGREVVPGGGLDALIPQIRERLLTNYANRVNMDSSSVAYFKKQMKWEKQFHDAGGLLVAGTDPTGAGRVVPGYANMHTIELLKEAGFSIEDVIKIVTLNGAKYMEKDHLIGSVEVGKSADLILIAGDLQNDVSAIREIKYVFKDGVAFDSRKLFDSVKGTVGLN